MKQLVRASLMLAATGVGSILSSATPSLAQTDQQLQSMLKEFGWTQKDFDKQVEELGLDWCLFGTANNSWLQAIKACTDAIKTGKYTGNALAMLFYQRAGAYYSKHDYEHAISDYDEAIRIYPRFALALYERGFAKRAIGDNTDSSADIERARGLQPEIGRLPIANFTCPVRGGSFVLTDADFNILGKDGMTKENFALLPPTSKARMTVCETRKIARVVSGKPNDCALDPYKYWVVQYLDKSELDKVIKVQVSKTAAMMTSGVKCR